MAQAGRARRWMSVAFYLIFGLLLATAASRPPAVLGSNVSEGVFSGERAMADVRVIASAAHPIGSADIDRVRAHLLDRLRELGLSAQLRKDVAIRTNAGRPLAIAGSVQNIFAELPGSDPALPAVLLMSHYDTVAHSPGAGDDTSGVAVALEIARNLQASAPFKRSVFFLFTDGEEPGLLGSAAFFGNDPLRERVGIVVNLEARGANGRTLMFQTSAQNGGLIRLYADAVDQPSATSLTGAVYKRMPNDTDLTPALARGIAGLNFAFVGGQAAYHTALSTPARLDARSLQHMGEQALAMTRAMAGADELPVAQPDLVYADVLGEFLIWYPLWVGWLLVALAALLLAWLMHRLKTTKAVSLRQLGRGGLCFVVLLLANAVMLHFAARVPRLLPRNESAELVLLWNFDLLFAGCALLVLGVSFWVIRLFASSTWGTWLGMLTVALLLSLAVQALLPEAGYLVTWPLLAVLASACVVVTWREDIERPASLAAIGGVGAIALGQLGAQASGFFNAIGPVFPPVLSIIAALGSTVLFPLIHGYLAERSSALVSTAVASIGLACVFAASWMRADAPQVSEVFYLADLEANRFYRASPQRELDAWADSVLRADGHRPRRVGDQSFFNGELWVADARPAQLERSAVVIEQPNAGGLLEFRLRCVNGGRRLQLLIEPSVDLEEAKLDGRDIALRVKKGSSTELVYYAMPPDGVTLSFAAPAHGAVDVRIMERRDGWPSGFEPPARPVNAIPWGNGDSTLVVDRLQHTW